ncbi:transducin family protein / WD-40 repeat family protein [Striga asiatica]|uniref:Transducin family protein / WD-40 repeat family protein n=1 Tax=Striga asiatica TaxID=4170 RepID=A0A5A7QX08_STRAF|nr:transducin family protein / WD-40 repeat family protein [Striga asiatica]
MTSLSRELVFLILQFLDEEKFKDTVHSLEKESGFFFNMRYFEDAVTNGEWEDVEKYLAGFTKVEDNRYSMKIFFEIRKQKFLEALDKRDNSKAVDILRKDLKTFSNFNEDLFKEITMLLTLQNFRENEQLSKYGDTKTARAIMLVELKKLIEANPLFRDKLQFPTLKNSRLRTLINQSLNWQHQLCKNPKPNPDIKTLFVDHTCAQPNGARAPSPVTNQLMGSIPKVGGFPPMGGPAPFPHAPAQLTNSLAGWMANPSSVPHPAISIGPMGLTPPNTSSSMLKRPRTPPTTNPALDYQTADSEHVLKRSRPFGIPEEVNNLQINMLPVAYPGQSHTHALHVAADDLPKTVMANLNQGSAVKTMDFHPHHQTLLLVGTNIGEIAIWEVSSGEKLAVRNFKVWDIGTCTMTLQASLANEYTASVNRVMWSPEGNLFGVAYSKHIVHLYAYFGGDDLRNHREIDAHVGSVNDLAFSHPNKQLCVITCGEDKAIKVWDAATGSRVDYDAPGHSCTTMAYSADGSRLFSCGTSKDGESFIVEWNESEGSVKRTYLGVSKRSVGPVQFDTTKNRFLAAGDEFKIKFWDMDNVNLLMSTDADGGLPASPCIRFSKDGSLLSVSTSENGVKILANAEGVRLMRSMENRSGANPKATTILNPFAASSSAAGVGASADRGSPMGVNIGLNGDARNVQEAKSRISDELEKSKIWKLKEINEQSQLRSLRLPDGLLSVRIIRLIYTNSGGAILALAYNAVHKLWKWQRTERNATAKATSAVAPQLWQPSSGILMTNDISETNLEEAVPCFALSKNDSYVMSASGGKISLFNMMTFKTMTTFMPPPPAATFLAFHPQDNNVIAIGMEDATIQIYNVRVDEVKSKLKGHQKRVTGLAFSNVLDILVSSGADAQICVWSLDGWEKKASKFLQIPSGRASNPLTQTRVQFHQDQIHVLIIHDTQIAVYEASKLECVKQWVPTGPAITDATYSCDSQSIYTSFDDGSVCVFTSAGLKLRCRINPAAYLPSNPSTRVYPLVITAHPSEPNQFALGLTDGGVHVLEPSESEGKWGTVPPPENGVGPSLSPVGSGHDQSSR